MNFKPHWWVLCPTAHGFGCLCVCQFVAHDGRNTYPLKKNRQNFYLPDQDKVVNRSGVGDNNDTHQLKPQAAHVLALTLKVFNCREIVLDPMGFKKPFKLIARRKSEQLTHRSLRKMAVLIFHKRECFQRSAR